MGAFPAIASNSEQLSPPVNGTLDSLAQRNAEPGRLSGSVGARWEVRNLEQKSPLGCTKSLVNNGILPKYQLIAGFLNHCFGDDD